MRFDTHASALSARSAWTSHRRRTTHSRLIPSYAEEAANRATTLLGATALQEYPDLASGPLAQRPALQCPATVTAAEARGAIGDIEAAMACPTPGRCRYAAVQQDSTRVELEPLAKRSP